jgi:hypothetical protein
MLCKTKLFCVMEEHVTCYVALQKKNNRSYVSLSDRETICECIDWLQNLTKTEGI